MVCRLATVIRDGAEMRRRRVRDFEPELQHPPATSAPVRPPPLSEHRVRSTVAFGNSVPPKHHRPEDADGQR